MPGSKTVKHPKENIVLTFHEESHYYVDNHNVPYQSATTFIKGLFPEFEKQKVAEKVAKRDGVPVNSVIAEWDNNRDKACRFGTRCHEIAEAVFNNTAMPHTPENQKEKSAFSAFWNMADFIRKQYKVCGAEVIVFDTAMLIAGTVDLLVWDESKKAFRLLDWKTNSELKYQNSFGQFAKPPLNHIQHCNIEHYAFQLALYEIVMKRNGYIDDKAAVIPNLLWLNGSKVEVKPVPDRKNEVLRALYEESFLPF